VPICLKLHDEFSLLGYKLFAFGNVTGCEREVLGCCHILKLHLDHLVRPSSRAGSLPEAA
jgi:hypothetical protein